MAMAEGYVGMLLCGWCDKDYGIYQDEYNNEYFECIECGCTVWDHESTTFKKLKPKGAKTMPVASSGTKFKVFEQTSTAPKEVYFKMRKYGTNAVEIIAVDENGKPYPTGHILRISPTKGVVLSTGVKVPGIPTDASKGNKIKCQ